DVAGGTEANRALLLVGSAVEEELVDVAAVGVEPLTLEVGAVVADLVGVGVIGARIRTLVPGEPGPGPVADDAPGGLGGGTGLVGVLEAEDEGSAVLAGVRPGVERRAGAADVERAGGAGGEAGDDGSGAGRHRADCTQPRAGRVRRTLPARSA